MSDIKLQNIQQACLYGIRISFNEYSSWYDARLSHAPEYLLNINIAKQLYLEYGDKFISLETNVKDIVNQLKIKESKDFFDKVRINGKFDLILWSYKKYRPKVIIEVKQNISSFRHIKVDIDRIVSFLEQDSKMKFGISTFFIDYQCKIDAKKNLKEKIDKIRQNLREYIPNNFEVEYHSQEVLTESIKNNSEEYSSFAVVFTIIK